MPELTEREPAHLRRCVELAREALADGEPVLPPAINAVAPDLPVSGPAPELAEELRALHRRSAEGAVAS